MLLSQALLAPNVRLVVHDSLPSTNDEAMRLAAAGDPGDIWIVAQEQTSGRGRRGRQWSSPPGNLYASLLLIDAADPARAAELTFVASLALARAVEAHVAPDHIVALKWPNDVLVDGAKISGLLLECSRLPDGRFACVIGCGVNCVSHPVMPDYATTDLAACGAGVDARQFLSGLAKEMTATFEIWRGGSGFGAIRLPWLEFARRLDRPLRVTQGMNVLTGYMRTIDDDGALVLATGSGDVRIVAGDVAVLRQTDNAGAGRNA